MDCDENIIKLGIFTKYPTLPERLLYYKSCLTTKNNVLWIIIREFNIEEIISEIISCIECRNMLQTIIDNSCIEHIFYCKYIDYLIKNNIPDIKICDNGYCFLNTEIIEKLFYSNLTTFDNMQKFIEFATPEMYTEIFSTNTTHIGLAQIFTDFVISDCLDKGQYVHLIFNKLNPKILKEMISLIVAIQCKNPIVFVELCMCELNDNIKLLCDRKYTSYCIAQIFETQYFECNFKNINENVLHFLCDNYPNEILTSKFMAFMFNTIKTTYNTHEMKRFIIMFFQLTRENYIQKNAFQMFTQHHAFDLNAILHYMLPCMSYEQQKLISDTTIQKYHLYNYINVERLILLFPIINQNVINIFKNDPNVTIFKKLLINKIGWTNDIDVLKILETHIFNNTSINNNNTFDEIFKNILDSHKDHIIQQIYNTYKLYSKKFILHICTTHNNIAHCIIEKHVKSIQKSNECFGITYNNIDKINVDIVKSINKIYDTSNDDITICTICTENTIQNACVACGHVICNSCTNKLIHCPFCRKKLTIIKLFF